MTLLGLCFCRAAEFHCSLLEGWQVGNVAKIWLLLMGKVLRDGTERILKGDKSCSLGPKDLSYLEKTL